MKTQQKSEDFRPIKFDFDDPKQRKQLEELLNNSQGIKVFDRIEEQLIELSKIDHPELRKSIDFWQTYIREKYPIENWNKLGNWFYYPWLQSVVHVLGEEEFIRLRTNRNQYKITQREQTQLRSKVIGIVGLSVGQSVAMAIAMERTAGTLVLADYDTLDLSNLNRLRAGIDEIGLPKTVICAREIARLDPYLTIHCFHEGVTEKNLDDFFFCSGKQLDLVIDECDGLDIKILLREKAKSLRIPVVMETSDRGMLDIERFDLEDDRPLLHGLAGDLKASDLKGLTNEEKIPFILPLVGGGELSMRMRASMMEVEQTLVTWPQLASSVFLGGALASDVSRRILLHHLTVSGRFYVDLEEIIKDPSKDYYLKPVRIEEPEPDITFYLEQAKRYLSPQHEVASCPKGDLVRKWVEKACFAPSGGNSQPWAWVYEKGYLCLFHNEVRAYSFLNFNSSGSFLALGAALEILDMVSKSDGWKADIQYLENRSITDPVCIIRWSECTPHIDSLLGCIGLRMTNRKKGEVSPISEDFKKSVQKVFEMSDRHRLLWVEDRSEINQLAALTGVADRIRLLEEEAHQDFISEIRWTEKENIEKRDGIDLETCYLTNSDIAALELAKKYDSLMFLADQSLGKGIEKLSYQISVQSSAIGMLSLPEVSNMAFLIAGRSLNRIWMEINRLGYGFQPISPITFLLHRFAKEEQRAFSDISVKLLLQSEKVLNEVFSFNKGEKPGFMFRIFPSDHQIKRSLRRPIELVFFDNSTNA